MKKIFLLLLLSVSLFSADVNDDLRVRGFATLDAVLNTSDDIQSSLANGNNTNLEKNKPNYNYSSLGAQLEWDISDSIDFMAQGIYSKEDEGKNYKATLEWLMLGYSFADDYKVRIGKMKVPFMNGTQTRNINYASLWSRPQVPTIGVNGFNDLYGVDLIKKTYIDDVDIEFQGTLGKAEHQVGADENNYLYNFSVLADYDGSWLRLSAGQTSFDKINPLGEVQNADVILTFTSIETKLSFNSWLFYAGIGRNTNNVLPDNRFIYASLAYEFDKLTPYLLFSEDKTTNMPIFDSSDSVVVLSIDGYDIRYKHAIGMRYDFHENLALKTEYNHKTVESNTQSLTGYDIYSITLDIAF